jgi:hypothetical protein
VAVTEDFEPPEGCLRGEGFEARLAASGYQFPTRSDPDDAQWVGGEIKVAMTGAKSEFGASRTVSLWAPELERFERELRQLWSSLSGEAVLTDMEGELELRVRLEKGRGSISGFVKDHRGFELRFESIPTDQSYLFDAVVGLGRIVSRFPSR